MRLRPIFLAFTALCAIAGRALCADIKAAPRVEAPLAQLGALALGSGLPQAALSPEAVKLSILLEGSLSLVPSAAAPAIPEPAPPRASAQALLEGARTVLAGVSADELRSLSPE